MKKQLFALLLLAALLLSCSVFACAEAAQDTAQLAYITDHAGILSSSECEALETRAAQIASQYPCSIYVVTVQDFQTYSNTVAGCASGIYSYYDLGYGAGRDGVLLLLSMDDRDYYVYSYGSYANTVFYGKAGYLLDEAFLDNFRSNDWYGGFADYLDECERLLLDASKGSYADPEAQYYVDSGGKKYVSPIVAALATVIGPVLAGLGAAFGVKGSMKTAKERSTAEEYVVPGGARLRVRDDRFINRTETRVHIPQDSGRGSGSSGGGVGFSGGTGHGGKF